nr:MAG TPA: HTH-type transcriptional regulator [Caudoviricetes sp.]
MRETKIMQFDWYTGNGTHDFGVELRERILNREDDGWEVDEVKIIPNKKREDWYDIFLILKRG